MSAKFFHYKVTIFPCPYLIVGESLCAAHTQGSPTSLRETLQDSTHDMEFCRICPFPHLFIHSIVCLYQCGLVHIYFVLVIILYCINFVAHMVPALDIGSSCCLVPVPFWHALLCKGHFWISNVILCNYFLLYYGQRCGDCWGKGGIRGLNGNGKNTMKIKFKKVLFY